MLAAFSWRLTRALLAVAGLLSLGACAVPLGPGYTIAQQQIEVRYVTAPVPHLAVRAIFRLNNTGNQPLTSIDVRLPDENAFRRENLRVRLDNDDTSPQFAPNSRGNGRIHIPLGSPWLQKQQREIVLAFDLSTRISEDAATIVEQDHVYLQPRGWYPLLLPPTGLFARGGKPPKRWDLIVGLPEGFLVHTGGRPRSQRKQAGEVAHRFEQRNKDPDLFVLAGRYREQRVRSPSGEVIFWTLQALPAEQAQRAGQQIGAAWKALEAAFGPPSARARPFWIVNGAERFPALDVLGQLAASFPDGAFFEPQLFVRGSVSDSSLCVLDVALAEQWLEQVTQPEQETKDLSYALAKYATAMSAEGCAAEIYGSGDRKQAVRNSLQAFQKAREQASQPRGDHQDRWRKQADVIKAELLVFDLEDRIGKERLNRALRRMIQASRGRSWEMESFHSALEGETGQRLGEFFRQWLNFADVPQEFRARYEEGSEVKK